MFLRSEGAQARSVASKLFAKQHEYATRVGGKAASNLSFSAKKKKADLVSAFFFCQKQDVWVRKSDGAGKGEQVKTSQCDVFTKRRSQSKECCEQIIC